MTDWAGVREEVESYRGLPPQPPNPYGEEVTAPSGRTISDALRFASLASVFPPPRVGWAEDGEILFTWNRPSPPRYVEVGFFGDGKLGFLVGSVRHGASPDGVVSGEAEITGMLPPDLEAALRALSP